MQKSFCAQMMLTLFVAAGTAQISAECKYFMVPFRRAGAHVFSVHGAFRDMVVKRALHEFVDEHLPYSMFFKLGNEEFNSLDIFKSLSDALADIADDYIMENPIDYTTSVRHAVVGHMAHKLWVAFLDIIGISKNFSDDVKEQYDKYGKPWFSKTFALCFDHAYASLRS